MLPKTYGDVMRPLDVDRLPQSLLSLYQENPEIREWVHLAERVRRAEKISSWTQWTTDESAAYEMGDFRVFSRLRGYSQDEIEEFARFIALTGRINHSMGDEDFCAAFDFEIQEIVATPEFAQIQRQLMAMSREAKFRE